MDERTEKRIHQLLLSGREKLSVEGVSNVGRFDRQEIILDTGEGALLIKGEGLHMQHLSLEQGKLSLVGRIDSLQYSEGSLDQKSRGGLWRKIFK